MDPQHTLLKPQHELSTLLLSGGFESTGTQDSPTQGLVTDSPQIDQTRSQSEASPLAATVDNSNFFCSFTESDSMGWSPQGIDYPSSILRGSTESLHSVDKTIYHTASTFAAFSSAFSRSEILSEQPLPPSSHGSLSSESPNAFQHQANSESKCQLCPRLFKDQVKLRYF